MPTENSIHDLLGKYRWLVLAVLVTATLQSVIIGRAFSIHVDGLTFIGIAKKLESDPIGTMRMKDQHPGYPALILAAATLTRPFLHLSEPELWTLATRLASGTCGVLSVVVFWLFTRRLFDELVANIAVLSFAVLPLFRMFAADALSDTQHLLFYLLAAWFATEAFARDQFRWFAAAGAASGAAYWVRPEGLEIALITGVLLTGQMLLLRRWRSGWSLVALGAAVMITVAPYVILAGKITSKQLPWAKRQAVPVYLVTETQLAEREEAQAAQAAQIALAEAATAAQTTTTTETPIATGTATVAAATTAAAPTPPPVASAAVGPRVVARLAGKAIVHFVKNIVWGFRFVFLPLYLIGNWELYRRRPAWWVVLLPAGLGALHIAVLFAVFFISGYMDQRHVIPIVAVGLPFAALGSIYVAEKLTALLSPRFSGATVLATVVGLSCVIVVPRDLVPMNPELQPVFLATRWIHEQYRPGDAVISNSPYIAFYSNLPGAELSPETPSLETALERMKQGGANMEFAVLDLQIKGYRPEWRTQIEQNYREVFRLEDPRSKSDEIKLLVYRAKHHADRPPGEETAGDDADPADSEVASRKATEEAARRMTAIRQAGKF